MNHFKTILLGFLVLQGATWTDAAKAENINLPYSGRLVNADASPVEGQVDMVVEFFSSAEGGDSRANRTNSNSSNIYVSYHKNLTCNLKKVFYS